MSPRADSSQSPPEGLSRWFALVAYVLVLLPALAFWWWQGRPVDVADAPSSRVPCVSYAPYQGSQTPFDESLVIPPAQIERDLRSLADVTGCVRTYSVKQGLEEVPRIANAIGMKVMLGAWIGGERDKNEQELARVIDLARRFPEAVKSVIVGNEVLLRREQPPAELAAMIRRVREAGERAGDLCRRLGILAEAPRGCRSGRFRHHSYTALLGGRAASRRRRDPARRGDLAADERRIRRQAGVYRRGRLALRRAHARGRATQPCQPGAVRPRVAGHGRARGDRGQPYRELRSALEAALGGNGRRPLGSLR